MNWDWVDNEYRVVREKVRGIKHKAHQRTIPSNSAKGDFFGWHLLYARPFQVSSILPNIGGLGLSEVSDSDWSDEDERIDGFSSIVITEGEFDAMAVYEATKRIAVSLHAGASSFPLKLRR